MRQLSLSIVFLGLMVVCGCGGGGADIPALGTVTGKVTAGGQPVAGAIVTFTPADGRPSSGQTESDGSYTLMYNVDNEGATIGKHTVLVLAADDSGDYEGDDPSVTEDGDGEDGDGEDEGEGNAGLPEAASDGSITKDVAAGANTINIEL